MKRRLPHGNLVAIALLAGATSLLLGMHDPPYVSHDEANSVSSVMIQNRAIGDKKLQLDVVRSVHIQNGSVFTYDIHDGTIQAQDMADNSVGSRILKQKSVKASHMNAAVAGSAGQALIHQGTHVAWADPDYAGVAHQRVNATGGTVGTSPTNIISRTITTPASGFVVAIATFEVFSGHTNGTLQRVSLGVSDTSGNFAQGQEFDFDLDDALPTGSDFDFGATVHSVFTVSAGAHTFFAVARKLAADSVTISDCTLTLLYVPNSYGTVAAFSLAEDSGAGDYEQQVFEPLPEGNLPGVYDPNISAVSPENADLRARVETLERIVSELLEER
jgi:hypothetical protein